jgi:hypothetical protein
MTLPGYEAQRVEDMWWAFSTKKQKDYDTALENTDITLMHPIREASVAEVTREIRSDKETYGKGHEFATTMWEVARDVRFTRTLDGSSTILGWALAFALGDITTIQPNAVGAPATYLHTMTFFDPVTETTAQLPVTSVVERVSAGIERLLYSLAMSSVTISAEGFEQLQVALEMIGSGQTATNALARPSMPTLAYLSSSSAIIKMGDAAEDISTRIRSWQVVINNNPRDARGYFPGSGLYRGRMEIGSRAILPSFVLDVSEDSDLLTDFLAGTEVALDLRCDGDFTEGTTYKHYLRIRIPSAKYRALPIEESDGIFTYAVTFDEESVLYDGADTPNPICTVEVQNTIGSYLVAAT